LDDWRRLVKPPVRSPNPKKLSIDLKIDTVLRTTPNEPVVELITADTEDMEVDPDVPDVDEVNNVEKDADPEIEEDEADEEASQTKLLKMPEALRLRLHIRRHLILDSH
jgi:hypothetical protein